MSTSNLSSAPSSTPALLALKRFGRGTLRQVGIGLASLLLMLSVSAHLPSDLPMGAVSTDIAITELSAELNTDELRTEVTTTAPSARQGVTTQTLGTQRSGSTKTISDSTPKAYRQPAYLLGAHMTHHRLTGARLSIPSASANSSANSLTERYTIANLTREE